MTEPWDRLPNERIKAYELFCLYRDMGPYRSLQKLRQTHVMHLSLRQLERYSATYHWVARAQAFSDHIFALNLEERTERILLEGIAKW
ncbi:MAG: hypothetical protein WCE82_10650 [Halobacteriota archaeon]